MANFKPWSDPNEDTSFERGAPISQAAKSVTKAVGNQVTATGKAVYDTLVTDWLYGTNDANSAQQGDDATKQAASGQHGPAAQQAAANASQSPEEQANLEKIRHELSGKFDVEHEMQKARQERERKEQEREEIERQEQEAAAQAQSQMSELPMPQGKRTGQMKPSKPQMQEQSMEIQKAKTATEAHRGTTG